MGNRGLQWSQVGGEIDLDRAIDDDGGLMLPKRLDCEIEVDGWIDSDGEIDVEDKFMFLNGLMLKLD